VTRSTKSCFTKSVLDLSPVTFPKTKVKSQGVQAMTDKMATANKLTLLQKIKTGVRCSFLVIFE